MGKNKSDYVMDNFYRPHAQGFRNNPTNNQQRLTERFYIRHLSELSANRFKWTGLPNSVPQRFLEMTLLRNGLSVFYFNRKYERYVSLRAASAGKPNMYDNPTSFWVNGNLDINERVMASDCVPIWANYFRTPDLDIINLYSKKLAEIDRSIEINAKNLRKTRVILADENQRLSWQNINRQFEEGVEVIYGTSAMDTMAAQVLDFQSDPQGVLNLQIVKAKMWNECMTYLGINNANQDKKERLVASEVEANDEQVFATKAIALNARREACEAINRKFKMPDGKPLNVWVDYVDLSKSTINEGGEENGNAYDDAKAGN